MKKTCLFLEDIYDDDKLIFQKFYEYNVVDEDDEGFYFIIDNQKYGMKKNLQNITYVLIQRELP